MLKDMTCKCIGSLSNLSRIGLKLLAAIYVLFIFSGLRAEILSLKVNAGDYQIVDDSAGQRIEMEGFSYLMDPGKPMLPSKNYLIALPPGARVQSVELKGVNAAQLPGAYRIMPSPPILPLVDSGIYHETVKKMQNEWQINNKAVYSLDQVYPKERGKLKGSGTLRKYSYASVSFYPFSYNPQSLKLIYYDAADININYTLPAAGSMEAKKIEQLKWDTVADERASNLFDNYNQVKELYRPTGSKDDDSKDTYDYLIITTETIYNAIAASEFYTWKSSLGYNVLTVLITDSLITSRPGRDLAEQIRNFLRDNYGTWGVEYVLFIGDYATVPMRYCYPNPDHHWHDPYHPSTPSGEVPTDYYYADLSFPDDISWDSDNDGYYGEYGEDNPDFLAEVYVGRIPTSDTTRINYALDKLVNFEQDTGSWKNQALHGGSILFFENQNHSGYPKVDGATVMHFIEEDLMTGWTISHYSEQVGLDPSVYVWPAINEAAFIDDWRNGQYGVVNWAGHGSEVRVLRLAWLWDDGDGVPEEEDGEMAGYNFISISSNLDDDYPSIVFAVSCLVGCPEPNGNGNLGVDLLTKPSFGSSVGVVCASRWAAVAAYWSITGGGAESICYEFNRYLINGPGGPEKVGSALYNSKFYSNTNYGWDHICEYQNMYDYNLYGDPALAREGSMIGYEYLPGDANMVNGIWPPIVIGGDVTYLVNYFKGIGDACLIDGFWCSADANGDCIVMGSDVIRLVSYFRGTGEIEYCEDYPPAWSPIPDDAPDGWPNCETPPVTSKVLPSGDSK